MCFESNHLGEVIKALTDKFMFPEETVSDNRKQFVREEFKAFLKSRGIKHIRVTILCNKQREVRKISPIP